MFGCMQSKQAVERTTTTMMLFLHRCQEACKVLLRIFAWVMVKSNDGAHANHRNQLSSFLTSCSPTVLTFFQQIVSRNHDTMRLQRLMDPSIISVTLLQR